jgi:hypothetical protein
MARRAVRPAITGGSAGTTPSGDEQAVELLNRSAPAAQGADRTTPADCRFAELVHPMWCANENTEGKGLTRRSPAPIIRDRMYGWTNCRFLLAAARFTGPP